MTFLDVGVLPVACVEKGCSIALSDDVYHPVYFESCVADGVTPDPLGDAEGRQFTVRYANTSIRSVLQV